MSTPLNILDLTRDYIIKCFNDEAQLKHFDRTVFWLKQLSPDADDYLLVAAMGHDIARSFVNKNKPSSINRGILDKDYLKEHQEGGAKILGDFLKTQNCEKDFINKVENAVSKHEVGGDTDQNLLKDADSISFLENNSSIFIKKLEQLGYKAVRDKFDWTYNKITSQKAKQIAETFYRKIINSLENTIV
jgi:hypothetical protein